MSKCLSLKMRASIRVMNGWLGAYVGCFHISELRDQTKKGPGFPNPLIPILNFVPLRAYPGRISYCFLTRYSQYAEPDDERPSSHLFPHEVPSSSVQMIRVCLAPL